jgi:hypothetical protein
MSRTKELLENQSYQTMFDDYDYQYQQWKEQQILQYEEYHLQQELEHNAALEDLSFGV